MQGRTQPAARLSERDLIALMEQHNIGTDATVSEHIQKQLSRGYATKDASLTFWPTPLGEALVGAYRKMGLENLWLPNLRQVPLCHSFLAHAYLAYLQYPLCTHILAVLLKLNIRCVIALNLGSLNRVGILLITSTASSVYMT